MNDELKCYKVCRIRCRRCRNEIVWVNRTKDDRGPRRVLWCKCGLIGIDPSALAYRVLWKPPATLEDIEDQSVEWRDEK